jgi:hypothetical protein
VAGAGRTVHERPVVQHGSGGGGCTCSARGRWACVPMSRHKTWPLRRQHLFISDDVHLMCQYFFLKMMCQSLDNTFFSKPTYSCDV